MRKVSIVAPAVQVTADELTKVPRLSSAPAPALLMVLDRPEIPLHSNGSERDIRLHVTKRKISGGTCSLDGRDALLGLMRTATKLGIAFSDYLSVRLSIPGQPNVHYLLDLLRCRGQPA
jgi:Transposase IS66 family